MKQTVLFLRNGQLFETKEAALGGIKGVAHVAGQPVVALYGEASSVKLIFAIGTEAGKCEIMATDADLTALSTLVSELRADVDGINNNIDGKISAAINALKGADFEAENLAALEDAVVANEEAIATLNGEATVEGSVAKAIADSEAATKVAYEAADAQLKSDLEGYADQAEADAIAAAAADAQAKIEALDVAEISEEGKYIVAVSEADGKISATLKGIEAKEVALEDANEHFTATTVEAALEELYSQAGAGSKVTMTSTAGEGDVATIYTFYQGGDDADHKIGEINIGKELMVKAGTVEYDEESGVPHLILTINDADETVVDIDLSKVFDVYTQGNGITVSDNVISVKKADDSEAFLVVDANGVAIKGVQDAINAAVKAAKDAIDAYTVNGYAISSNPVFVASDIEYSEGVTIDTKIDAVATAVADEKARAEEVEGNLQEAIEAAQAAATTVINEKSEGHVTVSVEEAEDGHKVYTVEENDIASAQSLADEIARAKEAEAALTEIAEDINAELYKVKLNADDENADYLANKVVSGIADEANNIYAATVAANEAGALAISVKIDTIDGGTY